MIRANQGESEIKGNIVQLETEFTVITKHLYNSFSSHLYNSFSSIHGEEFARAILKNAFELAFLTDEELEKHKEMQIEKLFRMLEEMLSESNSK